MILTVIGAMGSGKTLFSTLYAIEYAKNFPGNAIYANYTLKNLPNFHYTPYLFIPFSRLENALIIADDFYALKCVDTLVSVVVNLSRKRFIDLVLTCQYYTMIPPAVRRLSDALVTCQYQKPGDLLLVRMEKFPHVLQFKVEGATRIAGNYYDTREVVPFPTDREIAGEIKKNSENEEDIERNVMMFTKNKAERKRLLEMLLGKGERPKKKKTRNVVT